MGPETTSTPFVKTRPLSHVLDSPKSGSDSPVTGDLSPSGHDLPPIEVARETCAYAVDDAAALLRVCHKPSFWQSFERLYGILPEHYTNEDQKFLPLFYSAMALGRLFGKDEGGVDQRGYEDAIEQGFVHFKTARQMMDIADCRDLMSIQAVVFMILFLQSSAKLSQCYSYVGVALRSAIRMGLHRNFAGYFNPLEAEIRKRVFWAVRKMDIYVASMLGLPQTLSDDDIDQEFPTEVDDEYVTKDGILPMPDGQVSLMTAFNCHTRLVQLLSKIVRCVYPIKVQGKQGKGDKTYSVPFSTIREIENDLENWKRSLPHILSPNPAPSRFHRVQQLLRMSYAHAQVMLYRPFLHFVAMEKHAKPIDQRAYACAASYVNVSRNVIHITTQMKNKGLLNGAYWYSIYVSFFAILSLVYFAAENPENPTTEAVMKDALEGREVLAHLARRSMAADRCTATLDVVFQRLPEWMRTGQQNPIVSKKRLLDHDSLPLQPSPQASRSHPDVSTIGRGETMPGVNRRASTFPKHGSSTTMSGSPATFESWSQSGASTVGPRTPTGNEFNGGGYMNYNPQSATMAMTQEMAQYTLPPNNFANPAIADLSTLMFPAAGEPFSYPNQPLTTFENNQHFTKSNPYINDQPYSGVESPMVAPPSRGGREDDNMEAQFFALPPFIDQRQQQHPEHPGVGYQGGNMSNGQPLGTPTTTQMPNGWSPQQGMPRGGDLSSINIQDIFSGTEWNPMLGYSGHG